MSGVFIGAIIFFIIMMGLAMGIPLAIYLEEDKKQSKS